MNKYLKRFPSFFVFILTLAFPHFSYASDGQFPFERLPKGVKGMIVKDVAADFIAKGKNFSDLALVSKVWANELREFVQQDMLPWQPCWKAWLGVTPENEAIYRTFFNATLECRHNPKDETPAYTLPFISLIDFSKRFLDLPSSIEASMRVDITNNLQKFFAVGERKTHILISTKAMIAMRMKSMTMSPNQRARLDEMMMAWDEKMSPMCILLRSSDESPVRFDYFLTDALSIPHVNLYEKCRPHICFSGSGYLEALQYFSIIFVGELKLDL